MHNKTDRLIKMANDISDFFNAEPDKELAAEGVTKHILRAWEPRMRKEIINYYQQGGSGLSALAKTAVGKLSQETGV
jgi:formate dehydrogenase subunit delta